MKVLVCGELIVEIMRIEKGKPLYIDDAFKGPYPSGAPTIFIDAITRLGAKGKMVGAVGNDDFGKCILDRLKKDGVDTSDIEVIENEITGSAHVMYEKDGQRKFIFNIKNSAANMLSNSEIDDRVDLFHLMGCSLQAGDNLCKKNMYLLSKVPKETFVTFDPNIRIELTNIDKDMINDILKRANGILPGVKELLFITGKKTVNEAIEYLFDYENIKWVVVKNGDKGANLYTREKRVISKAIKIHEIDPTGAGDCFDAGFIFAYLSGKSLSECLNWGNICGAINASSFGPMPKNLNREVVFEYLSDK